MQSMNATGYFDFYEPIDICRCIGTGALRGTWGRKVFMIRARKGQLRETPPMVRASIITISLSIKRAARRERNLSAIYILSAYNFQRSGRSAK